MAFLSFNIKELIDDSGYDQFKKVQNRIHCLSSRCLACNITQIVYH